MFTWLFALLAALGALAWVPVAHACKCTAPEPPESALQAASAVFEGEVIALEDDELSRIVTLRVPRAWKGIESAEQIRVITHKDTAACGFPFERGVHYLIYADDAQQSQAQLSVSRCSRTRPLSEADADIVELGMGAIPVNVHAPSEELDEPKPGAHERKRGAPAAGGCATCSVGHASGNAPAQTTRALGLCLLGALALRVGRRRQR